MYKGNNVSNSLALITLLNVLVLMRILQLLCFKRNHESRQVCGILFKLGGNTPLTIFAGFVLCHCTERWAVLDKIQSSTQ